MNVAQISKGFFNPAFSDGGVNRLLLHVSQGLFSLVRIGDVIVDYLPRSRQIAGRRNIAGNLLVHLSAQFTRRLGCRLQRAVNRPVVDRVLKLLPRRALIGRHEDQLDVAARLDAQKARQEGQCGSHGCVRRLSRGRAQLGRVCAGIGGRRRDELDARHVAAKDSQGAILELAATYGRIPEEDRRKVEEVLLDWLLSEDESLRYDALFIVDEYLIRRAAPSLRVLQERLQSDPRPGAPYEWAKVNRTLGRLTDAD